MEIKAFQLTMEIGQQIILNLSRFQYDRSTVTKYLIINFDSKLAEKNAKLELSFLISSNLLLIERKVILCAAFFNFIITYWQL